MFVMNRLCHNDSHLKITGVKMQLPKLYKICMHIGSWFCTPIIFKKKRCAIYLICVLRVLIIQKTDFNKII